MVTFERPLIASLFYACLCSFQLLPISHLSAPFFRPTLNIDSFKLYSLDGKTTFLTSYFALNSSTVIYCLSSWRALPQSAYPWSHCYMHSWLLLILAEYKPYLNVRGNVEGSCLSIFFRSVQVASSSLTYCSLVLLLPLFKPSNSELQQVDYSVGRRSDNHEVPCI